MTHSRTSKEEQENGQEKDPLGLFFKPNTFYEVTINPDMQHYGRVDRIHRVVRSFTKCIDKFREHCEFEFYPELSEVRYGNKNRGNPSRWHYHGWIKFKHELGIGEFLLNVQPALQNYSDYSINAFRADHWSAYIVKQSSIMKPLCKAYRVPYNINHKSAIFKSLVDQKPEKEGNIYDFL